MKVGTILTPKTFELTKARAIADNERATANRGPINYNDIQYLIKALKAPDIETFLKII